MVQIVILAILIVGYWLSLHVPPDRIVDFRVIETTNGLQIHNKESARKELSRSAVMPDGETQNGITPYDPSRTGFGTFNPNPSLFATKL